MNRQQRRAADKTPTFQQAVEAHQNGDLETAERMYRRLIAAQPRDVSSLRNLGLILVGSGRVQEAVRTFQQAVRANPAEPTAHAGLGAAYRELGQFEAAVGALAEAVRLNPRDGLSHSNLGMTLRGLGRDAEAKVHLAAALDIDPTAIQPKFHLAGMLFAQGELVAAAEHLAELAQRAPGLREVWSDLGLAYDGLGRSDEAVACFERAIACDPTFTTAIYNLGGSLQRVARHAEAIPRYQEVLALEPDHRHARVNLGLCWLQLGRIDEAIACYEEGLRLAPDEADLLSGLADALKLIDRRDEAIELLKRAAQASPGSSHIMAGLGDALQEATRPDEAVPFLSEAVRLDPASSRNWVQLLLAKSRAGDWRDIQAIEQAALARIETEEGGLASPFPVMTLNSTPQQQLTVARRWSDRISRAAPQRFTPRPAHGRDRVRVGYLSADFRNHATAYLATGLFEAHDRAAVEVVALSINPSDGSPDRQRLEAAFDRFVDLHEVSHAEAARTIHEHEIDILIDLKGYTGGARPDILALRPAPIQVNYLGYPGTMGADFIDYIVADPVLIPPHMDRFYSEKVVRLPGSYQPNMERPIAVDETTRRDHDLPDDAFVFCSFNSIYKITPAVFDVWMRLLQQVPGSVLWLLAWNDAATVNLKQEAAARGVDPARVIFAPPMASPDHLARHRHADLFLDTLPVCAHTTASDALWGGLPLITCVGESFISRVSASLLTSLGLTDAITQNLADYEALALRLATNPDGLKDLKDRLAAARTGSELFQPAPIARYLEAAYREMWRRHKAGEAPTALEVARG